MTALVLLMMVVPGVVLVNSALSRGQAEDVGFGLEAREATRQDVGKAHGPVGGSTGE